MRNHGRQDRIDEWWNRAFHRRIQEASLGRDEPKESPKDEALEKAPRLRPGVKYERAGYGVKGLR